MKRYESFRPIEEESQEEQTPDEAALSRETETYHPKTEQEKAAAEDDEQQAMSEARAALEESRNETRKGYFRADLYGPFGNEHRTESGSIALAGEVAKAAEGIADDFRDSAKAFSDLVAGETIAAEYATRTSNFRAQTRLGALPDGRRIFMIYDYRGSWLHRTMDGVMKRLNGLPMRKAGPESWKRRHAERTSIPVIENADDRMIMMPYVPNANAKDIFASNREIADFGSCTWAKDAGLKEKNALAGKIVDEMRGFHDQKGPWGEAVLSNVILTTDQKPVMCDFEVAYDKDVPLVEAKARDLKDLCVSVSAVLEGAHGQDVGTTVKTMLDRYGDAEVLRELKKLASQKRGFFRNLFFGYEQARTGAKNKKQYDAVSEAIVAYGASAEE